MIFTCFPHVISPFCSRFYKVRSAIYAQHLVSGSCIFPTAKYLWTENVPCLFIEIKHALHTRVAKSLNVHNVISLRFDSYNVA